MTQYNRGDVILVPFPFSDQTTIKKRPAIIVSSNTYNSISQDVVIMSHLRCPSFLEKGRQ